MTFRRFLLASVAAAIIAAALPVHAGAQQVSIGSVDIGGVVMGPNGPEAGVWVIAGRRW